MHGHRTSLLKGLSTVAETANRDLKSTSPVRQPVTGKGCLAVLPVASGSDHITSSLSPTGRVQSRVLCRPGSSSRDGGGESLDTAAMAETGDGRMRRSAVDKTHLLTGKTRAD